MISSAHEWHLERHPMKSDNFIKLVYEIIRFSVYLNEIRPLERQPSTITFNQNQEFVCVESFYGQFLSKLNGMQTTNNVTLDTFEWR